MTLQDRLNEAEQALHDLAIGKSVAELRDSNGETVRYTVANRGALNAYIADLRRQLGLGELGPMRPLF